MEDHMDVAEMAYDAAGLDAVGYLASPHRSDPHEAVLICHEGPGRDDHVRWRADRIASELGYTAFALDYHEGGRVLSPVDFTSRLALLRSHPATLLEIARAGLAVLSAQPHVDVGRLAVLGFCFGGTMTLELGRAGADVRAIVALHAGLEPIGAASADPITARVFAAVGTDDPLFPTAQHDAFRTEMATRNAHYVLEVFEGVGHCFTNKSVDALGIPGIAFHEPTDRSTWSTMSALLAETIGWHLACAVVAPCRALSQRDELDRLISRSPLGTRSATPTANAAISTSRPAALKPGSAP